MNSFIDSISAHELRAARLGRTWAMLSVKESLSTLPVEEAFAAFVQAIERPAASHLTRKPVRGLHELAALGGGIYHPLQPAGDSFVNTPSRVIGVGDHRVLSHTKRSLYLAAFEGMWTRGRSQLLECADQVLLDFEGQELSRVKDCIELDGAVFRSDGDQAWVIDDPAAITLELDECFSLLGPNSFAFGHWIVEYLPRLEVALDSGLLPQVPILIDEGMNRQHRQALELLLPPGWPVIEVGAFQRVRANRFWFVPTYYYAPIYPQFEDRSCYDLIAAPPDRFRDIFEGMKRRLPPAPVADPGNNRLFLARRPNRHRKLLNYERIEAIAQSSGYRIVHLEDLDFNEQVDLVRCADRVIGPEGSAFFLAFFARPGTRAGILNHPHTMFLTGVTALLEAMGIGCTVLTGPFRRIEEGGYTHHSDYEIDPDTFSEFLESW